jgi:hypothetical protein
MRTFIYDNGGKTSDRYTVILPNKDIYLMSENANAPNGVCIYLGKKTQGFIDYLVESTKAKEEKEISFFSLPSGVQKQIVALLKVD